MHNDLMQRRSENYQTTSEGSTSPESSSESSAEDWESGEFVVTFYIAFRLNFLCLPLSLSACALHSLLLPKQNLLVKFISFKVAGNP
jgi:hypothetical protein